MRKSLKRTQAKEDAEVKRKANELKNRRREIEKKFRFLKTVDDSLFQYSYLKAQADEICDILEALRLSPFKGFYQKYKALVTDEVFMNTYYLKMNKYKEISPDNERLSEFLPIKIILEK